MIKYNKTNRHLIHYLSINTYLTPFLMLVTNCNIYILTGTSTVHASPPNLQFNWIHILVVTDISMGGFDIVPTKITWLGTIKYYINNSILQVYNTQTSNSYTAMFFNSIISILNSGRHNTYD